uniref:Uncharacterized protein n=1 Tax=Biomphalaria glabrata TaxID=6526 RepID=A0A2C9KTS7_BIOGL
MDLLLSSPVQCHIKVVLISLLMIVVRVNANEGQCLHEQHDNMVRFHCPVHHSYQKMMMTWTFREVSMPASKVFLSCRGGICREDTLNRHTPYFDYNVPQYKEDYCVVTLTNFTLSQLQITCTDTFNPHYVHCVWNLNIASNSQDTTPALEWTSGVPKRACSDNDVGGNAVNIESMSVPRGKAFDVRIDYFHTSVKAMYWEVCTNEGSLMVANCSTRVSDNSFTCRTNNDAYSSLFHTNLVLQDGNVVLNFMLTTYTITKLKVKCYKYFHYSRTDTKIWDISLTDNQESESKDEYFLPIFISLAVFVTILIFVVIVCLVCRRRKNSRPRLPRPRPTTSRVRDRVSTAARNTPQQTNVSLWLTQISAQLQTSSYIQRPPPYDEPPSYESLDHSAGHIAMRTISIINEGLSESRDFDLEPPPPYPTT